MIRSILYRLASFTDVGSRLAIDDLSLTKVAKTPPHSGVNSSENPLHVAAKLGQPQVVAEILSNDPKLALELNCEGYTALHLACWSGNLEVVKLLVEASPELCLVKDKYGRTSLHTASMKGRVSVLRALLGTCPESVMELTTASETPLHIAVTHAQEEAVRLLVDWLKEKNLFHALINKKDCGGNTILHLAIARKQLQTINLLLDNCPTYCAMVEVNAINGGGFTALDILDVLPQSGKIDMEIEKYLRRAGALRTKDIVQGTLEDSSQEVFIRFRRNWNQPSHLQTTRPMKTRYRFSSDAYHALLLTATLLATITFYTALKPPGARLEESYKYKSSVNFIFIEKRSQLLTPLFVLFNSIAFFTSAAILIVLMHDLPLQPWPLISVFSMLGAYICSIMVVSPHEAMALLSLCSPAILLAAVSKYLALHRMVL